MLQDLEALKINSEQLDDLLNLDVVTTISIDFYRGFKLKDTQRIFSVLLTEFFALMLILIFVMPVSMMVLRELEFLPENSANVYPLLIIIVGISLMVLCFGNLWILMKVKQHKSLAILLKKVDQYNQVIAALIFLKELNIESNLDSQQQNSQELIAALTTTKASLIDALQITQMMRKYQGAMSQSSPLLINLEHNLEHLMTFDMTHQNSQYRQLLNDAVEIGISVHRELRKLQK
jgi:hypothetical protein